ncbi:hypothetical protein DFH09DRAFT_1293306 [Mycena vulgaris]|nr:hypothetical protein DFH09DRAFT_1293306 [Mycena vulgaris]
MCALKILSNLGGKLQEFGYEVVSPGGPKGIPSDTDSRHCASGGGCSLVPGNYMRALAPIDFPQLCTVHLARGGVTTINNTVAIAMLNFLVDWFIKGSFVASIINPRGGRRKMPVDQPPKPPEFEKTHPLPPGGRSPRYITAGQYADYKQYSCKTYETCRGVNDSPLFPFRFFFGRELGPATGAAAVRELGPATGTVAIRVLRTGAL